MPSSSFTASGNSSKSVFDEPTGSQLGSGAPETSYGLAVALLRYRHIVGFVADINACCIRMDHFHAEVFALSFRIISRRCLRFISCHLHRLARLAGWLFSRFRDSHLYRAGLYGASLTHQNSKSSENWNCLAMLALLGVANAGSDELSTP